jgi:hypothetical protein
LDARLATARNALAERDLPALVVYTDVWRSNQARYLTNFMPYWNRSLAVIPRAGAPLLLCGLSPRVYPWIKSVTVFEEIRPAGKLVESLIKLCAEREWKRIGVLDLLQTPEEIHAPLSTSPVAVVDVPAGAALGPGVDGAELAMRRRAVGLARTVLAEQVSNGTGITDYQFVGRLERAFRRAGAEDLVIAISNGETVPAPAKGALLNEEYSVAVALEYCGHWVKVTRAQTSGSALADAFSAVLRNAPPEGVRAEFENLSGAYPYYACNQLDVNPDSIYAVQVEDPRKGRRLFYGDTCYRGSVLR